MFNTLVTGLTRPLQLCLRLNPPPVNAELINNPALAGLDCSEKLLYHHYCRVRCFEPSPPDRRGMAPGDLRGAAELGVQRGWAAKGLLGGRRSMGLLQVLWERCGREGLFIKGKIYK